MYGVGSALNPLAWLARCSAHGAWVGRVSAVDVVVLEQDTEQRHTVCYVVVASAHSERHLHALGRRLLHEATTATAAKVAKTMLAGRKDHHWSIARMGTLAPLPHVAVTRVAQGNGGRFGGRALFSYRREGGPQAW